MGMLWVCTAEDWKFLVSESSDRVREALLGDGLEVFTAEGRAARAKLDVFNRMWLAKFKGIMEGITGLRLLDC